MASEKPTMILTSKSNLSAEEIAALNDAEAWWLIYSIRSSKAKHNRLQICFTGFNCSQQDELIKLAQANRFKVVNDISNKLDYLVGGDRIENQVIDDAIACGVQYLDEQQFIELLEMDELESVG